LVRGNWIRVFVLAMAMAWVGSVAASTTTNTCMGKKLKTLAKKESGLLVCQAKVAATGDSWGLSACETKVSGKFDAAFTKAGACAGDQTRCKDFADACDSATAAFLTDTFPSTCEAAKRNAADKLAGGELVCYAKAATKGLAIDASCVAKAQGKFEAALSKAGTCPDGGSPQIEVENNCVQRAVNTQSGGMITDICPTATVCGTFLTTWGRWGNGPGEFQGLLGVAVDHSGNVFTTEVTPSNRIQKFENNGTFLAKWGGTGSGPGQFGQALGVAVDGNGNVFVADLGNNRVEKFDNNGAFLTAWGSLGSGDGQFNLPHFVAVDGSGNVLVTDYNNNRVEKFDNNGTFLTTWGSSGSGDGQFSQPEGIAVDGSGNVFVAEQGNNRIQKFDNNGAFLTTWGSFGSGDGQFKGPSGSAVDGNGNVLVVDQENDRVQKFDNNGTFLTTWGSKDPTFKCPSDIGPATCALGDGQFSAVRDVAVDGNGNVLVTDLSTARVQKFACP
jgi:streptogramin lyase